GLAAETIHDDVVLEVHVETEIVVLGVFPDPAPACTFHLRLRWIEKIRALLLERIHDFHRAGTTRGDFGPRYDPFRLAGKQQAWPGLSHVPVEMSVQWFLDINAYRFALRMGNPQPNSIKQRAFVSDDGRNIRRVSLQ